MNDPRKMSFPEKFFDKFTLEKATIFGRVKKEKLCPSGSIFLHSDIMNKIPTLGTGTGYCQLFYELPLKKDQTMYL